MFKAVIDTKIMKTRNQLIDESIKEAMTDKMFVYDVLRDGFKGYAKLTDAELVADYEQMILGNEQKVELVKNSNDSVLTANK